MKESYHDSRAEAMDTLSKLFATITADQAGPRQITRITVSPRFWQKMTQSVREVWQVWHGFPESEMQAARPPAAANVLGVPLEIDEAQRVAYRLWTSERADH